MNDAQPSERVDIAIVLLRAFLLGQTYWQQADSENYILNKKAEATAAEFRALVDETVAALSAPACPACGGSGESTVLSGGGPDAYEVSCDCQKCEGHGVIATPPAEAGRQPLTETQISNRLWEAEWPESMLSDFVRQKLIVLIRSVERAHGIEAGITGAQE